MGDGISTPITAADFIPVVGKNYIAPHLISIPTAVYVDVKYDRSVFLIAKTPATVGTCKIYPGAFPADDNSSISIPSGQPIFLDARGEWYVKTGSSGTEQFLVIDGGGGANAQAVASLLGGTGSGATPVANRGSFATAVKNVTTAGTPVNCASLVVPNGFALVVKAKPQNTSRIGVGNSSANANIGTGSPHLLEPGAQVTLFITNANLIWLDSVVNGEGVTLCVEA